MQRVMPPGIVLLSVVVVLSVVAWIAGRELAKSYSEADRTREAVPVQTAAVAPEISEGPSAVAGSFQSADLHVALEKLPKAGSGETQLIALFHFAEQLTSESFPDVLEAVAKQKDTRTGWWRAVLLELWAERDLGAATQWFMATSTDDRAELFPRWADTWARLDAEGLRRWLTTRPEAERKTLRFSSDFLTTLTEINPSVALNLRELYPEQIRRETSTIMEVWAKRDPQEAAARSMGVSKRGDDLPLFTVMEVWGKSDPQAALAWVDELNDPVLAERGRFAAAIGMGQSQGIAAMDVVRSRFPEGEQTKALTQIAWGVSRKDPDSVIRWAQENAEPLLRREMVGHALQSLSSKLVGVDSHAWPLLDSASGNSDASRLADLWLSESTATGEALRGVDTIFTALAEQKSAAEAAGFLDRLPPQFAASAKNAVQSLARQRGWAYVGAAGLQLPPGLQRSTWLEQALTGLTTNGDVMQAQALARQLSDSERGPLVRAMAGAMLAADPDASARMLLELPEGRAGLQQELVKWIQYNPQTARRWIAGTSMLMPEEKQQLLTSAK